MPRRKRDTAKRECVRAAGNLDAALEHVRNLQEMGYDTVPDIWDGLTMAASTILSVQEIFLAIERRI